jgi:hypothetical protein
MTEYERFQAIMVEINYKVKSKENKKSYNLPPGFEDIFNEFKK